MPSFGACASSSLALSAFQLISVHHLAAVMNAATWCKWPCKTWSAGWWVVLPHAERLKERREWRWRSNSILEWASAPDQFFLVLLKFYPYNTFLCQSLTIFDNRLFWWKKGRFSYVNKHFTYFFIFLCASTFNMKRIFSIKLSLYCHISTLLKHASSLLY